MIVKIGGANSRPQARLNELDVTVTVDPVRVNGQAVDGGVIISGDKPPLIPKNWWPWIIGAGALTALWWLVKDDAAEEGAGVPRPFVG